MSDNITREWLPEHDAQQVPGQGSRGGAQGAGLLPLLRRLPLLLLVPLQLRQEELVVRRPPARAHTLHGRWRALWEMRLLPLLLAMPM